MDFWHKTVVVAPVGRMCKAKTPVVEQSRAAQWRAHASRRLDASDDMVHCDYAQTCETCKHTSPKQSHMCLLWWFMIPHRLFWQRKNHSSCINWPHSFMCLTTFLVHLTLHDGMCKATTAIVKQSCMTSQWRQLCDVAVILNVSCCT